jgi:hypothetical protein
LETTFGGNENVARSDTERKGTGMGMQRKVIKHIQILEIEILYIQVYV